MNEWPAEIESAYAEWLEGSKNYEHRTDLARFFRFVELCARYGDDAPTTNQSMERLRQDYRNPDDEYSSRIIEKHAYRYGGVRMYIGYTKGQ